MAQTLSIPRAAEEWKREAERRSLLIRELMWDDEKAFFFDYNYVQKKQIPVWSLNAFWVLWAGIATKDNAAAVVSHLPKFLCAHGLAMTDREYPSPHPEFEWLQWNFPSGWPPFHIMVVEALLKYGYEKEARLVASRFLKTQIRLYQETGKLWEKYNVVAGNLIFPKERYEVPPLHGWSSASVVLLGRLGMPPVTPG
jgi:alpha,alpha-trehalase